MTYYEEDIPDIEPPDEEAINDAENEGMPLNDIVSEIPSSVEHTDPGVNHQEMMEMLGGIFIQLSRIYDVMMMMSENSSRVLLEESHSQGELLGDPPILKEDAWS